MIWIRPGFPHHGTDPPSARQRRQLKDDRPSCLAGEAGIALLTVMLVILLLSGFALSMATLTTSQLRMGKAIETQTQVYYAALAGLEEARGRIDSAAPDALTGTSLPGSVTQVVYLVNGTTQDPVQPTSPASAYYDTEYAQEFSGGLASATVLAPVTSDQPGAGTISAIPYKWVRITMKTEYSSGQDVNQDGTLDNTTPVYWDGAHQNLTTTGIPVFKLTALAVDPSGVRQTAQLEVAGRVSGYSALGGLASGGSATLTGTTSATPQGNGQALGLRRRGQPNLVLEGNDIINPAPCGAAAVPGLITVGTANISLSTVDGAPTPTQQVTSLSTSPATFINSLRGEAAPILSADSAHVGVASGGTSYVGTNVVLGIQSSGTVPAQPAVIYSDKPLTISGTNSTGDGILMVTGDLSITGSFDFNGLIVVDGAVTLTSDSTGSISIQGSIINAGNLSADSTQSATNGLIVAYDSCSVSESLKILPKAVLAFRLL